MREQIEFQKILTKRLNEIRARNPSFSIRAFAKKIGLGSAAVFVDLILRILYKVLFENNIQYKLGIKMFSIVLEWLSNF